MSVMLNAAPMWPPMYSPLQLHNAAGALSTGALSTGALTRGKSAAEPLVVMTLSATRLDATTLDATPVPWNLCIAAPTSIASVNDYDDAGGSPIVRLEY